jgi:integrase
MARGSHLLTARGIAALKEDGAHSDGGGLYLIVKGGSRTWQFWHKVGGKRLKQGLGPYPAINLADARAKAASLRAALAKGESIRDRPQSSNSATFGAVAEEVLQRKMFRSASHQRQWERSLRELAKPLSHRQVAEITRQDIIEVLSPHWQRVPETAQKLRARIEKVLARATALDLRTGNNPAGWRDGLKELLEPQDTTKRGHFDAMPYAKVPALVERLRPLTGLSTRALLFAILTAARSGEVRGADWREFDLTSRVWRVPKERMKAKREHAVPLSDQAIEVLESLPHREGLVFPNAYGAALSQMALAMALRRALAPKGVRAEHVKADATVHGFRSSFRDWCSENGVAREIAELCLAHLIGNAVEQAYARSTVLNRRREVMQSWADFVWPRTGQLGQLGMQSTGHPPADAS